MSTARDASSSSKERACSVRPVASSSTRTRLPIPASGTRVRRICLRWAPAAVEAPVVINLPDEYMPDTESDEAASDENESESTT